MRLIKAALEFEIDGPPQGPVAAGLTSGRLAYGQGIMNNGRHLGRGRHGRPTRM